MGGSYSLQRQFIIDVHLRPVPILSETRQPMSQVSSLGLADTPFAQVDRAGCRNPGHDHSRPFNLINRLREFDFAIPIDSFNRFHHDSIMSRSTPRNPPDTVSPAPAPTASSHPQTAHRFPSHAVPLSAPTPHV